jgi:hypothetical protein
MKFIICIILIMFVVPGCAIKSVNQTERIEPEKPVEPVEPAEGVMPEMPPVKMPEIPDVKMAVIPDVSAKTDSPKGNNISINQVVEAACGQCQFRMTEKSGCDLAVKIDGESYFVDGTTIHDHGDAHADDGFCVAIRQVEVKGEIIDGRFKAESFTLVK